MAGGKTPERTSETEDAFFAAPPKAPATEGSTFSDDVARVGRRAPSTWRSPLLMAVVIAACGWLAWGLVPDVRYFFAPTTPVDLGKAESVDLSKAHADAYVHVKGIPSVLKVTYKQFGDRYEVYYLLGSRLFVRQALVKHKHAGPVDVWSVFDGAGRMVDIDRNREYSNIKRFYAERGFHFREPTWMVLAGERPRQHWMYPVLVVVLAGIALFNLFLLVRRLALRR